MSARVDRGFSGRCLGLFRAAACLFPASALAGGFVVAPTDLQFGSVFVNDSASIAVVIANVSGIPQMPNFAGGAPFDQENFGGFQNCAGVTLPPGGSCTFTYVFHPISAGPKSSSTVIAIDGTSYVITMAGTGLFPIAAAPLSLDFGSVMVGADREMAVTITNISGVPQTPNYAGGAPFDQENFGGFQNCAGVTLASGGSCAFTYVFHPASIGLKVSSTTIGIDDQNFAVALRGNGVGDLIFANGFD